MTEPIKKRGPTPGQRQSGFWAARRALQTFGEHAIDGRSAIAKALQKLRVQLINDMGGEAAISTQQRVVISLALKTHLLLESLDNFIFGEMQCPVNKKRRTLYPVVRERQQLADSLARYMQILGMERRAALLPSLQEYLASKENEPPPEPSIAGLVDDSDDKPKEEQP
jgi:hypothetical protein